MANSNCEIQGEFIIKGSFQRSGQGGGKKHKKNHAPFGASNSHMPLTLGRTKIQGEGSASKTRETTEKIHELTHPQDLSSPIAPTRRELEGWRPQFYSKMLSRSASDASNRAISRKK